MDSVWVYLKITVNIDYRYEISHSKVVEDFEDKGIIIFHRLEINKNKITIDYGHKILS